MFSAVNYFAFCGLPQLLQQAGKYDVGVVGLLMLPLAAMSVFITAVTVRFIERFSVWSVMIARVVLLTLAYWALGLRTLPFWPLLVLTALMGVPYGVS